MKYYEFYPASWVVDAIDPVTIDARHVADVLRDASPAGVGGHLHFALADEGDTFAFASGDDEEPDAARGWADELSTTGGELIGAS